MTVETEVQGKNIGQFIQIIQTKWEKKYNNILKEKEVLFSYSHLHTFKKRDLISEKQ